MKKFSRPKISKEFGLVKKWIVKNKFIVTLFFLSTSFFLYHHYSNLSWDFSIFVLNAKYWVGSSNYYEVLRPPLMSFLILILSPLTWQVSEYIYIIIISAVFMFSTIKLSG